jgi:beta-lactamase superfamily II metal-dependent hydrolase
MLSRRICGRAESSSWTWWRSRTRTTIILDGLHSVLANFKIGELWIGKDEETTPFLSLLTEARERGIPIVSEMQGAISIGMASLLSGDIEKRVENELVDEQAPRVAVVSVGEGNQFGHPVDVVVERKAGVRFLRTDRDGAVAALTDGHDLTIHTFAQDHPR